MKHTLYILITVLLLHPMHGNAAFFSDSFESRNFSHTENGVKWNGTNIGSGDSMTVSADRARTGTHSAKFHFAGRPSGDDAWSELRFDLGANKTEIFIRFYVWFPPNFTVRADNPNNNKFMVLWAENYSDPFGDGMEFWYENGMPRFVYKTYISYNNGWNLTCAGSGWGAYGAVGTFYMDNSYLGKWTSFELHYKLDSGAGNGAFQMWVDGVLKINGTNLSWVGAPCSPGYYRNGYLMGWANSGYAQDTDIYIDDVVFSDTHIGLTEVPFPTPMSPTINRISP